MNLSGKVALITGASQGIGAACAAAFGRRGASLSLVARSEEKLRAVGGPEALITPGDLCDAEVRRRVVEATLERFGAIDVLVNNAGVGLYSDVSAAPMAEVTRMWELNVMVPLELIQLVAPAMIERRSGAVVNVGSIAGKVTLPWISLYSASKYALGSLTDGLRLELRDKGVHAIAICPGYVRTNFRENALAGRLPASLERSSKFQISAEECAEAIANAVERGKRTVVIPRVGWIMIGLARMFPWLVDWQLARMYRRVKLEE
ncbi:MAG: SDR family NAD(P)-dependent oxidoreductase [Bryobacteraceae bacterium]|nr:SDR family NAD(P)-dependent oxidoreductase [Bryobacteraceae bacterium]